MIKKYNKEINDNILNQMYKILIDNLFITYPNFLEKKEKHDNEKLDTDDVNVLNIIKQYFEDNAEDALCFDNLNFKQFSQDLNIILERVR